MIEFQSYEDGFWVNFSSGTCDDSMLASLKLFANLVHISSNGSICFEFDTDLRQQILDIFTLFETEYVEKNYDMRLTALERDVAHLQKQLNIRSGDGVAKSDGAS